MSPRLSDEHRAQLHASGLTEQTIERAGLYTERDQVEVHRLLNQPPPKRHAKNSLGDCLVFPCFEPGESEPYAHRVRPDHPRVERRKGKVRERKYESPRKRGALVYFPPNTRESRLGSESTLYITEGEKKSLLLDQLGYPVVGLAGVWLAHDPKVHNPPGRPPKSGPFELHPRIKQHVRIADRDVVIAFDSDACEKPGVWLALVVLARMLLEAGARSVRYALPPSKPCGEKLGIDDYYMEAERRGESGPEAVARLLAESSEIDLEYELQEAWRRDMITADDEGTPKRGLANVMNVLAKHPAWQGVLVYDEFRECIVKQKPPPVRAQDGESSLGEWQEVDSTRTAAWFATVIGFEPKPSEVTTAVESEARQNAVHPVRDYLGRIEWDSVPRLDGMLTTYFGAADTPYTRAVGARWLIAAVARVMEPGCQVDSMLVLEGKQGAGKSTAIRVLAGDDCFADTGISIGDKDSYQNLNGVWMYEFPELDSLKGREVSRTKAFISSRHDKYRPSYGRLSRVFPRQVVFVGTTNEDHYLTDSTGNRRFWPVRCGDSIDTDALRRDRDQLWAEARFRYDRGESWHLETHELGEMLEREHEGREVEDSWTGIIGPWLAADPRLSDKGVTTGEVMAGALKLAPKDMNRGAEGRVGMVLRKLGWTPGGQKRENGGVRVRRYRPERHSRHNPSQPSAERGCDTDPAGKQGSDAGVTTVTTDSHVSREGKRGESAPSEILISQQPVVPVVPVVTAGPCAQVRTAADLEALARCMVERPSELERLLTELVELEGGAPANDIGRPAERPTLPCMAGDLARWWRRHPEALRRDAGRLREAAN